MPCGLERWEVDYEDDRIEKETNKKLFGIDNDTVSMLTGFLCEATKELERIGILGDVSPELYKWVQHHKKQDRKRGR
jgi:hypothetical protein